MSIEETTGKSKTQATKSLPKVVRRSARKKLDPAKKPDKADKSTFDANAKAVARENAINTSYRSLIVDAIKNLKEPSPGPSTLKIKQWIEENHKVCSFSLLLNVWFLIDV